MTKTTSYKNLLTEELKTPEFKKEHEALADEFSRAEEVIQLRLKANLTQTELARRAHT